MEIRAVTGHPVVLSIIGFLLTAGCVSVPPAGDD